MVFVSISFHTFCLNQLFHHTYLSSKFFEVVIFKLLTSTNCQIDGQASTKATSRGVYYEQH